MPVYRSMEYRINEKNVKEIIKGITTLFATTNDSSWLTKHDRDEHRPRPFFVEPFNGGKLKEHTQRGFWANCLINKDGRILHGWPVGNPPDTAKYKKPD